MNIPAFKKIAFFTDIHFGKKSNSAVHNQDCLNFIDWFCEKVQKEGDVTHIIFLGDWFENRSSINVFTLEMSYRGAKKIDTLGIPVLFVPGNHDLHRRTTREIHSVNMFQELDNFHVIDEPTLINNVLVCPFLFEEEYKDLAKFIDADWWCGHFEFRNFFITGYNTVAMHGPDHTQFKGPKKIFSGHYHKRQVKDNVVYIGNTFPCDFGDASDLNRGMCFYDCENDSVFFENWEDCPKYYKTTLSEVASGNWAPAPNSYVKCLVDIDVSYSEAQSIRESMIEMFELREFSIEEDRRSKQDLLNGEDTEELDISELQSIEEIVVKHLEIINESKIIDNALLIKLFKELRTEDL